MARISAAVRRRLVQPLPERFATAANRIYSTNFDLALEAVLAALAGEPPTKLPEFVRVDADPAEEALEWLGLFRFGLPKEQEEAVNSLFSQITSFSDRNTRRSLPGIPAETFFPRESVRAMQLEQIRKVKDAARWQVDQLDKLIRDNRGMHPNDLRDLIIERTNATKRKASLWARDQVLKFNAAVTKERHKQLGVEEYVWTTSQDERVRERHRQFAGRTFPYNDPPLSDSGKPVNPGEDYQCRCIAFPVTPSAEILGTAIDYDRINARQARAAKILAKKRKAKKPKSR